MYKYLGWALLKSFNNLEIMRNLKSVVHVSFHESPCTYRSCLMHHSIRHWSVRIGNHVKRSSRVVKRSSRVVKCDGNQVLDPMWVKHKREAMHVEGLSNLPRHNQGETVPKFEDPFGLHDVLQDPVPRGESLGARLCNFADSLVTSYLTPSELKPSLDPSVLLSGIFAPVCETDPTECRITYGRIPEDLDGVYLRNGPNAALLHRGGGIHAFDGDGMIHAVRMRNGSASFCSRFVKTSRFRQEQAAGRPLLPKILGGMHGISGVARVFISGLRVALGLLDVSHGIGLSNTNVAFFNGHILSLSQEDLPYILRVTDDGDVLTLRQFKLPSRFIMCSHPKFDPVSGDMYAHSLQFSFPIHYSLFRVPASDDASDDDGGGGGNVCCVPLLEVPVPALNIPMAHDFAITQRFIIFPDDQIVFRLAHLTMGETPLGYDANKTGRFCLLPRDSDSDSAPTKPQWFEAPGINCFHYLNAWEEGEDEVVLIATEVSPADRIHEFPHTITFGLSEIRFDTRKGVVTRREICAGMDLEFGVFNRKYTGRKTRYAYYGIWSNRVFKGVVKLDLMHEGSGGQESLVAKREFGEGKYTGEPCFVEARGAKSEDHGYLLCLVGDKQGGVSELWILDALSPTLEVIAIVELPAHVPPGFHGCFVNEDQLAQQKP